MKAVTVAELIEHLKKFDPSLPVCYETHSGHALLELWQVDPLQAGEADPGGWIGYRQDATPAVCYLSFPGY